MAALGSNQSGSMPFFSLSGVTESQAKREPASSKQRMAEDTDFHVRRGKVRSYLMGFLSTTVDLREKQWKAI